MLTRLFKTKSDGNSKLSEFVRTASSREKKRIYSHVIDQAIVAQNALIEKHSTAKQ
ncbi:hypothetical protein [Alkalimonas mucilaginosa]|uniref:Uncharacterized protein n=1 Tax=Alkalimonas mucilaginosa TaxID=3057676 RepID=A0ABU7JGC5_9GAMM|nr:hypothetical protein [Alkalimonas sp. MEB004]MEE2024190.1 hypothetical protein [Alkalimonas sp. MEB004]